MFLFFFFFFQAEDGIRDYKVTGVQTCALPIWLRQQVAGVGPTRVGGYASTTYKLGQRWIAGLRYDYVEQPDGSGITRQLVPSLTLWESEWVFLRAQYTYERSRFAATSHQIALQAVWAVGPHKHETY